MVEGKAWIINYSQKPFTFNKANSTMTPEFDPLKYALQYYYVSKNRKLADGSTLVNACVSPNFKTLEEARRFRDECGIDDAQVMGGTFFCRDQKEHHDLASEIFAAA